MKFSVKMVWIGFWSLLGGMILIIIATNYGLLGAMPSLEEIQNPSASEASEVFADDGKPMGKFYLEDRSPVELEKISPNVIKALIATEDERFYDHSGIDGRSLLRAVKGVLTFSPAGGASTITQQLALNMFGGSRSYNKIERAMQKVKEWIIAVKLERNFTKDEIIAYYLNTVSFGDNVFGIRNAAITFFQKEPMDLTVDEAALLVGVLKANTAYNPRRFPEASKQRRNVVLDQMIKNNFLSPEEGEKFKAKPIALKYKKIDHNVGLAPYFRESALKDEVKKLLDGKVKLNGRPYNIYRDGLKIYTTINIQMQQMAEESVEKGMIANQSIFNQFGFVKNGSVFNGREKELKKFIMQSDRWRFQKEGGMTDEENMESFNKKVPMTIFSWRSPSREKDTVMSPLDSIKYLKTHLQCSFMAVEPMTGHVKAWVGGYNFKTFKIDHANLKVKRQVGSAIKPMLYAQAIEEAGFTPESMLENRQQYFPGSGMVPASNKGASGGVLPMANALALSRNGAAAYLIKQLGPVRFVDFLKRCQVQTELKPFPSLALGSCDLSLYELMWMYTMFPGRGFNIKPQFITRIEDRNGNVIATTAPQFKEVVSEVTAYTMAKMMMGAIQYGTATRMKNYNLTVEVSAKTGTTNDNTDAWFVAYTPELLCGSWVGCDENWIHFPSSSAAGYGGAAALPIVGQFLKEVYSSKSLGYDPEAKFVKPPVDKNDIIYDYIENASLAPVSGAEGGTVGAGTEEQYLDDIFNEAIYESNAEIEESEAPLSKKQIDSINQARIKDSLEKAIPQSKAIMPAEPPKTKRELRREARQQKNEAKKSDN